MGRDDNRPPEGAGPLEQTRSVDGDDVAVGRSISSDRGLALASTEAPAAEPEDAPDSGDPLLPVGARVGEYVIERVLGSGGFGTVYEAVQPAISKRVAIKVLAAKYSFDPKAVARFAAEARVTNQIGHPNIVGVFSFGRLEDGRHYHVMDFVSGETLETLLERRGALPLATALPVLRGIASALDAAHRQQVVHRDLKPANVLLADHGGTLVPKVIDFGVAKLLSDEAKVVKTRSGALIGTPLYMSPEQCRGRNVDHRSDVYSFGVVMYEMLTGKPPFEGKDAVDLLLQHTTEEPAPPSQAGDLPEALGPGVDELVLRLLAKDPDRRPTTLGDVIDQLEALPEAEALGPRSKRAGAPAPPARAPGRTRNLLLLSGAALGIAALGFALRGGPAPAEAPAPTASAVAAVPPPAPSVSAPTTSGDAPPSTRVRIAIVGPPDGTEVRGPSGELLGALPGPIELPRSESPVKLELSRKGYAKLIHELVPRSDQRLELALPPLTRRSTPKGPNPDETERPAW